MIILFAVNPAVLGEIDENFNSRYFFLSTQLVTTVVNSIFNIAAESHFAC